MKTCTPKTATVAGVKAIKIITSLYPNVNRLSMCADLIE